MDPLRASLGNNEFTRLVANKKFMYYNEIKINLCYIHMQIFFENYCQCKVNVKCMINQYTYRTRAIISRGLYFFYPIFTSAAAYITDNLCTKNGNSSFFKPKIRGL